MTTIVVTGGRDYSDSHRVSEILDTIEKPILLIHGGASGADDLCAQWAKSRNVATKTFNADWRTYGKSAGPRRNKEMMEFVTQCDDPKICVTFPGGAGTNHAKKCAKEKGLEVLDAE